MPVQFIVLPIPSRRVLRDRSSDNRSRWPRLLNRAFPGMVSCMQQAELLLVEAIHLGVGWLGVEILE